MATVAHPIVKPYVFKTAGCTFKLEGATDTDDFGLHVGEITLTPTTQSGSWTGIGGNVVADQGVATWTAQFNLIQDLDQASLLRYLFNNEGKKATVVATLASGAGTVTFTPTLTAATLGGPVGANPMASTVQMAVTGKPVWA